MHLKISNKISIGFLIGGIVLLIVSLVLAFVVFPYILYIEVGKAVRLEQGTSQWDRFLELPFPLHLKIYLFEITNPDEVRSGEKPALKERGPYTYHLQRSKREVTFEDKEDTVSYYQDSQFTFNESLSGDGLSESDTVTFLNIPYLSMLQTTEKLPSSLPLDVELALSQVFETPSIFFEAKVKELVHEGVRICDPNKLESLSSKILCLAVLVMNLKNMEYLEDGSAKFSLFHYKWNTDDGRYTMKRGMDDIDTLGQIQAWNGLSYTTFWGNEENVCNKVEGYDSTLYPPYNTKDRVFEVFSTDIYRKMFITFLEETTYQGITGYRYGANESTLHEEVPAESCYCLNRTKNMLGKQSCHLDGTMDMYSSLRVPALLSLPHFLYADYYYATAVRGLNASVDKHLTFVDLEPNTGTPLRGGKRFQVNFVLRPISKEDGSTVELTKSWPRAVLPAFWLDEGMELPEKYVDELNSLYFNNVKILDGVKWGLISLSVVITIVSGGFVVYHLKSKTQKAV